MTRTRSILSWLAAIVIGVSKVVSFGIAIVGSAMFSWRVLEKPKYREKK
jgi:hypothetical protein